MKTQIITFGLLLVATSFTSCKKNQTVPQQTTVTATAPTQVDSTKVTVTTTKDSVNVTEKGEKGEYESNEKNEKE